MATLARRWAGHIYGTNTGNLYADFAIKEDTSLTGTIRIMDAVFGLTVFSGSGSFANGKLHLEADPSQVPQGVQAGTLEIDAVLMPEGNLRGEWKGSIGTAGTFVAFPHEIPEADARQSAGPVPEQIYSSIVALGALRLFTTDVNRLIQFIRKDFVVGRVVVTYRVRGNEVSKYADEFERELPSLGNLRYLKVTVQEPEAHGINKAVFVELDSEGNNQVRTQGIHESWVVGKAEAVARLLRDSERTFVTTFKKYGLGLNQVIVLAALVSIPEIASLPYRAAFMAAVVALLISLQSLHGRFIPNMVVYGTATTPSLVRRMLPSVLSWLAGIVASVAAALIFWWITGKTP